jgi:hypothetical protein
MEQFTLDETKAAEWLAASIAQYESGSDPAAYEAESLADIGESYEPRDVDECGSTEEMIANARYAGVITGPGEIEWDFSCNRDGEAGYKWLLYLGDFDAGTRLVLASYYEELRHLGEPDTDGAEAALSVLREAVSAGNELLASLGHYVASLAA